jgi:DNA-directed RNA polymerase subunit RPC12/RpoP
MRGYLSGVSSIFYLKGEKKKRTMIELEPIIDEDPLKPCFCVKCGKEFYPTSEHRYKDYAGRYCSWTCFNHRKDGRKYKYQAVECLYADGTPVRTFQSATKAAEWIGGEPTRIKEACNNNTFYKNYYWRVKV